MFWFMRTCCPGPTMLEVDQPWYFSGPKVARTRAFVDVADEVERLPGVAHGRIASSVARAQAMCRASSRSVQMP